MQYLADISGVPVIHFFLVSVPLKHFLFVETRFNDFCLTQAVTDSVKCVQLMNRYEDERRGKLEQRTQLTAQLEAPSHLSSAASVARSAFVCSRLAAFFWARIFSLRAAGLFWTSIRPTLLRLVKRIEVGEKYKITGETHRDIKIYYNFVGYVEL